MDQTIIKYRAINWTTELTKESILLLAHMIHIFSGLCDL